MDEIFVVFDLETSGLNKKKDVVLEIGALHIDMKSLSVLNRFQIHAGMSDAAWNKIPMDEYVTRMHVGNGLYEAVRTAPLPCSEHAMDHWLTAWFMAIGARQGERPIILCGNSVHFDRGFVEERLPAAAEFLHHRLVDTSAMRTVFKHWCGEPVKEAMKHRALEDCFVSLNTMRWQRMINVAGHNAVEDAIKATEQRTHSALQKAAELAVLDEWDLAKFQDESAAYFLVKQEEEAMAELAKQAEVTKTMEAQAKRDASEAAGTLAADISEFEADLAHEQRVNAEVASLLASGRGTQL